MKPVRLAVLSIAALAAVGLTAGCGPAKSGAAGGPSPSPSADPQADLKKALVALNDSTEKLTLTVGGKQVLTASVDLPDKSVDIAAKIDSDGTTVLFETLTVGPDVYLKLDFGKTANKQLKVDPKKWMKIDLSKIDDKSSLGPDFSGADSDPMGMGEVSDALTDVATADGLTYTATLDLTAAPDSLFEVEDDAISKYGDQLKAVPVTVVVDGSGHVASIKTDGTGIGDDITQDLEFSDFGQVTVAAPTGAVAAPSTVYQLLNAKG